MSDRPAGEAKAISEMSFEEALKALEGVVEALEGGQVPLERSLDLYERGKALQDICEKRLHDAEMRVEKILVNKNGNAASTAPLDQKPTGPAGGLDDEIPF